MLGTSTEGIIAERTAPEVAHRPSRWWVPSMPWRSRLRPFQLKRSSRCGRRGPCPCWPKDGPTKENALAAEKELGQAMRTSDDDGYCRLLDPDWAVVNGIGGLDDGVGVGDNICAAIKAGTFTRKAYDNRHLRSRPTVSISQFRITP